MHEEDILEEIWDWYKSVWKDVKTLESGLLLGLASIILLIMSILIPLGLLAGISFILYKFAGFSIFWAIGSVIGIIVILLIVYGIGKFVKEI